MRRYETIFIIDPELSDEGRNPIFDRLKDLIQQHEGFLIQVEEWGSRKLAYDIKKKSRGYYVRLDYCGQGTLVNEIERFFRIDDRILKYMTVLLEKAADLDQIKEEMAQAEAEAEQAAQEKAEKEKVDQAARDAAKAAAEAEAAAKAEVEVQAEDEGQESEAAPEVAVAEPEVAPEAEEAASEPTPAESDKEEK